MGSNKLQSLCVCVLVRCWATPKGQLNWSHIVCFFRKVTPAWLYALLKCHRTNNRILSRFRALTLLTPAHMCCAFVSTLMFGCKLVAPYATTRLLINRFGLLMNVQLVRRSHILWCVVTYITSGQSASGKPPPQCGSNVGLTLSVTTAFVSTTICVMCGDIVPMWAFTNCDAVGIVDGNTSMNIPRTIIEKDVMIIVLLVIVLAMWTPPETCLRWLCVCVLSFLRSRTIGHCMVVWLFAAVCFKRIESWFTSHTQNTHMSKAHAILHAWRVQRHSCVFLFGFELATPACNSINNTHVLYWIRVNLRSASTVLKTINTKYESLLSSTKYHQ